MNRFRFLAAAIATVAMAGTALAGPTAPRAKVSMAAARAQALKLAPGKLISAEYEREGGGWRYSFDIQQRGHVQEIGIDAMTGKVIGIDAMTGKVVENKSEGVRDRD